MGCSPSSSIPFPTFHCSQRCLLLCSQEWSRRCCTASQTAAPGCVCSAWGRKGGEFLQLIRAGAVVEGMLQTWFPIRGRAVVPVWM